MGCTLPLVGVAITFAFWWTYYRHYIGTDQISYLIIAEQYASGDFWGGVNSYWSPLTSWLLAPPVALGLPTLQAYFVLGLATVIAAVVGLGRIARRLHLPPWLRVATQVSLLMLLEITVFYGQLADTLGGTLLIWLMAIAIDIWRENRLRGWLWLGGLAMLAVFAKQYNLWFVGFGLAFVVLARVKRQKLKQPQYSWWVHTRSLIHKPVLAGLIVLLPLGLWVAVLSTKYGQLTYSAAGPYNQQLAHCDLPQPYIHMGLTPLQPGHAYTPWENITVYPAAQTPMCAAPNAFAQVPRNLHVLVHDLLVRDFEWVLVLVLLPAFVLGYRWRKVLVMLLGLAAVYTLPYVVLFFHERYVIVAFAALVLATAFAISRIRLRWLQVLGVLLLLWAGNHHDFSKLWRYRHLASLPHDLAVSMRQQTDWPVSPKTRFAVWNDLVWEVGHEQAYLLGAQHFGRLTGSHNDNLAQLRAHHIDYVFARYPQPALKSAGWVGRQLTYLYVYHRE